eukprot:TRINITY_DN1492_c0_g2_i1.p1 TRINITY_DN1492_c0_g2~~TRINITY_DN1492_c0_g2_i1.p1  ORF type:complete len:274 (-),score=56.00 TRINITY_DN1492_c0_g2_i1:61-882(-)
MRKKIYIEELEQKVHQLTTENGILTRQLSTVMADKKKLEERVVHLQDLFGKQGNIQQPNKIVPSLNSSPRNLKTAGVCLLLVLFSFSMLMNSTNSPDLPFTMKSKDTKSLGTGRALKAIKNEPSEQVSEIPREVMVQPTAMDISEKPLNIDRPKKLISGSSVPGRTKIAIAEENNKELVPLESYQIKTPKDSNTSELIGTHVLSHPDTNYIYCSQAQQVHSTQTNPGQSPQNIALLIPSHVLNSTEGRMNNSMLEVTCQVLNLHFFPMSHVQH